MGQIVAFGRQGAAYLSILDSEGGVKDAWGGAYPAGHEVFLCGMGVTFRGAVSNAFYFKDEGIVTVSADGWANRDDVFPAAHAEITVTLSAPGRGLPRAMVDVEVWRGADSIYKSSQPFPVNCYVVW